MSGQNGASPFQAYLSKNIGAADIDGSDERCRVELAAALDKLLVENGYEYKFDESEFGFTLNTTLPDCDFLIFKVDFIVSPPNIIVSVRPKADFYDISAGNMDAASAVVREFRNTLGVGTFDIDEEGELVFFAYTDWYGGADVPKKPFLHFLVTLPMVIWVNCLDTVIQAAEGSLDVESAKHEIRQIREKLSQHAGD